MDDPPSSDYLNQFDPMLLDQQLRDLSRLLQIFHPLLTPPVNSPQNSVTPSSQWTGNCVSTESTVENNQKENDAIKGSCSHFIHFF